MQLKIGVLAVQGLEASVKIEKLGKMDHILRVFVLEGHKAKRAVQLLNYVHGLGRLNVIQDAHRI